jgi:hypothetical protein
MKKMYLLILIAVSLPCSAGYKKFLPEKDSQITAAQMQTLCWKVMGLCDKKAQICVFQDTVYGYIVQLRRLDATKFIVRDVDDPISVNQFQEGSFLSPEFRKKNLKLVSKSMFTEVYSAKRGKITLEVNPDNGRVKNLTIKN